LFGCCETLSQIENAITETRKISYQSETRTIIHADYQTARFYTLHACQLIGFRRHLSNSWHFIHNDPITEERNYWDCVRSYSDLRSYLLVVVSLLAHGASDKESCRISPIVIRQQVTSEKLETRRGASRHVRLPLGSAGMARQAWHRACPLNGNISGQHTLTPQITASSAETRSESGQADLAG
jgi:hypothetical protein